MTHETRLTDVSSSTTYLTISSLVTANNDVTELSNTDLSGQSKGARNRSIEAAVYGHIKAIRALARTTVNTADIAKALGISIAEVESTVVGLIQRGVRLSR